LLAAFLIAWLWAAVNPVHPRDWLVENLLVFAFIPLIFFGGRYFILSNVSYTLITIFMILHVIGSHYTYAETPIGFQMQEWFGSTRNTYDRFVHFMFGFLLAYPMREIFARVAKVQGFWGFFFPLDLTVSLSGVYEIIEWLVVKVIASDTGAAFLGTQGDEWDAHKDILCAAVGGFLAMVIIYIINVRLNPDFRKEMRSSFKLARDDKPLGETALQEWAKKRRERMRGRRKKNVTTQS
jgi:putative membrane protein